ncbi:hypothetical protein C8J56DRAFT_1157851 [Mycena floridula]|nr:hypothetical protein C8J56DRAFT_1157851 [Mycena floridula]
MDPLPALALMPADYFPVAAAEATVTVTRTIPYEPPVEATVTVTRTVTEEAPLVTTTRTFGRPWTTATPYEATRTRYSPNGPPTVVVEKYYPYQPQGNTISCHVPHQTKTKVHFLLGGLAIGLFFCFLSILFALIIIRRLKRRLRIAEGAPEPEGFSEHWTWLQARTGPVHLPKDKDVVRESQPAVASTST